jgi:hypothetical protein
MGPCEVLYRIGDAGERIVPVTETEFLPGEPLYQFEDYCLTQNEVTA